MLKYLLPILLVLLFSVSYSQQKVVKYFDSSWEKCSVEKARYKREIENNDSFYAVTSYYYPSKKLYEHFYCVDSNTNKKFYLHHTYYESGALKDSAYYAKPGQQTFEYTFYESGNKKEIIKYAKEVGIYEKYAYYENGKLWAHISREKLNEQVQSIAFDSAGNLMPNYIYERPADFPGGIKGWQKYLGRSLDAWVPVSHRAPAGKYTVYVTFIIDKEGNVNDVKAENDPGYGTMEEAIRVIRKGPKWIPAVKYNKPVKYRHKQGITFQVSEQ